jgi:glutathione S-transferase
MTEMANDIRLYSFAGCPFAQRTRMTLIEKGLSFALTEVDLFDRPDWFRDVSPYGKVPVLLHEGATLYESAIINQYLDERFPDPPLMPPGSAARAQARIWMDYCDTRLLPALNALTTSGGASDRSRIDALSGILRFIEREGLGRRGPGPFWFGGQLTLADIQFAPFFERFAVYRESGGAEWPDDCTRLAAWFEAVQGSAGYRATALPLATHLDLRRQMLAAIAAKRDAANRPQA